VIYKSQILKVGDINSDGDIYTAESLEKMSKENNSFSFDGNVLYFEIEQKELDPELSKIIEDNLWDLV